MEDLIKRIQALAEDSCKTVMLLPERYNEALVGHAHQGNPIYDYNCMISIFMKKDGMTLEEAMKNMDFNFLHVYLEGDKLSPLYLFR